ncbi:MAG TPA: adenylate/guanylate cyclase domain-containing protein [Isosphaeraceae bacterium]
MTTPLQIKVYDRQQVVYSGEFTGRIELGRQCEGEDIGRPSQQDNGTWRVVIARFDENTVSRLHALIEPLSETKIRLTNLSAKLPIRLPMGTELGPRASSEVTIPAILTLGQKTVRVQGPEPEVMLQSLAEVTRPPGVAARLQAGSSDQLLSLAIPSAAAGGIEIESLVRWLQAIIDVLQEAANRSDFFEKAAEAMVSIIGLDSGRVLTWERGEWTQRAAKSAPHIDLDSSWQPSRLILNRVYAQKRTLWQAPDLNAEAHSLIEVKAVVAAPILNRQGEVIGALYGDRRRDTRSLGTGQFTRLEALLVELLANGVAAGLARLEQEKAVQEARAQFELFFRPELARKLAEQPDLMNGRDAEVSILFADIRGFSRISETLGPARTVEWINAIMGDLSDCVLKYEGVLVDYIGDELMAMWGAPEDQPDHARLACLAALDMLEMIPRLNAKWGPTLGTAMDIGIGINTGAARVGNTGSRQKFKYGPLGNTVNLASRVQGATKYLKAGLLITESTRAKLGESFPSRRLCSVSVVNIKQPVDLHELVPAGRPEWDDLRQRYELALVAFERKEFSNAAGILGNLLAEYRLDGPSILLLSRVVPCLVEEPLEFDPVWKLPGK